MKHLQQPQQPNLENIDFTVPEGQTKVLLHSCCAPCSGPLIEKMHENGIDITIFFYNPNIHPLKEYEIRKNENKRYEDKLNIMDLKFLPAL